MKKTVYVLQEKADSIDQIVGYLKHNFDIVGSSTDGSRALGEIAELKPNFLVTGLICSGIDGFAVMQGIKRLALDITTVVVSAITNDEVIKLAMESGARYYMVKPIDGAVLSDRLASLSEITAGGGYRDRESLDEKISKIFISVGIPPHIKGYAYLREGVKMAVESPEVINNITKKLYPGIGEKYRTSASKVERAIRHAIEVAWNRNRIDSINSVFGVRAYVGSEKPTNGEFIALVADKMILERA
ncbi:MAG: sporulation transcription factor Spo0A [Clostridia bacterium]|nr:sporulation transcription factor Spo0A [Clostridia bacterium]